MHLDDLAIIKPELIGGGVVGELGIREVSPYRLRDRVGEPGRHSPGIPGRTAIERGVLDVRIAVRVGREREPEALAVPGLREGHRARMNDLVRLVVRLEVDGHGLPDEAQVLDADFTIAGDNDAVGGTAELEHGTRERDTQTKGV